MKNNIDAVTSLSPAARTATENGVGVDLQGFDAATVVIQVGTITDGTHTLKIQESDDNSTFTDVDAADLIGTLSNLASDTNQRIGYIGIKKYIRVVSTVAGTTSGGIYGALVIRGNARTYPLA